MTGLSLRDLKLILVIGLAAAFGMATGIVAMIFVTRLAEIASR